MFRRDRLTPFRRPKAKIASQNNTIPPLQWGHVWTSGNRGGRLTCRCAAILALLPGGFSIGGCFDDLLRWFGRVAEADNNLHC